MLSLLNLLCELYTFFRLLLFLSHTRISSLQLI
nr:MAG TPA: hypothetical protein [Caudoviricetes sp.]